VHLHSLGWPFGFVNFTMAIGFETTREIGLALPVEPPKAHNLDREGLFLGLPVQKNNLEEF